MNKQNLKLLKEKISSNLAKTKSRIIKNEAGI